ncbi:hypothetical protein EVAR_43105_1 [Eumeta japonica]|uniref:Uncharacterized protein n=1 Tax=Eumeta variegata TaxID=151549 RepID=A0A4C1YIB1_EUMVA|nr:hypothetical protein EVAR_43105_1 [Eumeta japonica]
MALSRRRASAILRRQAQSAPDPVHTSAISLSIFEGQTRIEPPERRWSSPLMEIRNLKGVTNASSISLITGDRDAATASRMRERRTGGEGAMVFWFVSSGSSNGLVGYIRCGRKRRHDPHVRRQQTVVTGVPRIGGTAGDSPSASDSTTAGDSDGRVCDGRRSQRIHHGSRVQRQRATTTGASGTGSAARGSHGSLRGTSSAVDVRRTRRGRRPVNGGMAAEKVEKKRPNKYPRWYSNTKIKF